jgi:hypothetical protein
MLRMNIESDDLKKLYQRYITSKIPDNRSACPSPMALFNSFKPSKSLRYKKNIISHVTNCSYCREEFELILELQRYQASSSSVINAISSTSSTTDNRGNPNIGKRFMWRYAYFLFGLLLILSAYLLIVQQNSLKELTRTSEQKILLITPTHVHAFPNPLIFKWQELYVSQYYILELFDNSLLPVWTSQKIVGVQVQLPEEVLSHLRSGNYYFWMITAFSSTQKISESELTRFLVLTK